MIQREEEKICGPNVAEEIPAGLMKPGNENVLYYEAYLPDKFISDDKIVIVDVNRKRIDDTSDKNYVYIVSGKITF